MRIRIKLSLLILLFVSIFCAVIIPGLIMEDRVLSRFYSEGIRQERERLDKLVELRNSSLEVLAYDYTYWDELVNFVKGRDEQWAHENIDTTLSTYKANIVAIYRPDYSLRYSVTDLGDLPASDKGFIPPEIIPGLFAKGPFCHFFLRTPSGIMEIRGSTINYTNDPQRKSERQGYFFAGMFWDKAYIDELSKLSGYNIKFTTGPEEMPTDPLGVIKVKEKEIVFSRVLKDFKGEALAHLDINVNDERIAIIHRLQQINIIVIIVAAIINTLVGLVLLRRWVILKLEDIEHSLNQNDSRLIDHLAGEKDEFSVVARLVQDSFKQRSKLTEEIKGRQEIEEDLRLSEERFKGIIDNIGIGVAVIGMDMEILSLNKKMQEWFPGINLNKKNICYRVFNSPSMKEPCPWCPTAKTLEDGLVHESITETPQESGIKNFKIISTALKKSGKIIAAVEMVEDITGDKTREDRLAKINECFLGFVEDPRENINKLVNLSGEILKATSVLYYRLNKDRLYTVKGWHLPADFDLVSDAPGHISYDVIASGENKAFVVLNLPQTQYANSDPNVLRYKMKTYMGQVVKTKDSTIGVLCVSYNYDFSPSEEDKRIIGIICSALATEERRSQSQEGLRSALKESEDQRRAIMNILEDIQEAHENLRVTQSQLVQASKMSALGQLASGVAHEINNPLTGVLNNVQLIKMEAETSKDFSLGDFKELLGVIEESALRCKKITQSMLEFAHTAKGKFSPLSFNEVFNKVAAIIEQELLLSNIKINKELQPDLPKVMGDSQLLGQAILGLFNNAKWAIGKNPKEKGGIITIKAEDEPEAKILKISVSDTGIGIPKENILKLFTPFFTTKDVGEGTGLGLALIYNIIKSHNGDITVESRVGIGTTFTITLPYI